MASLHDQDGKIVAAEMAGIRGPRRRQRAFVKASSYAVVLVAMVALVCIPALVRQTVVDQRIGQFQSHHRRDLESLQHDDGLSNDYMGSSNNVTDPNCKNYTHAANPCDYVRHTAACQPEDGFINYLELDVCIMHSKAGTIVVLIVWLVFLFIALGATAEEFFCPSLSVISDTLKLSHNVAGVTFLALGNGAPDIFSAYSSIVNSADGALLAIGSLFGAGMFVTSVVVGAVSIAVPFQLTRRPFIRDVVAYLIATIWTYYILWDRHIEIYEAVGFIAIYVGYVVVVVVGRVVYQSRKASRQASASSLHRRELQERKDPHRLHAHTVAEALDVTESLGVLVAAANLERRTHHTAVTRQAEEEEAEAQAQAAGKKHRHHHDADSESDGHAVASDYDAASTASLGSAHHDEEHSQLSESAALLLNASPQDYGSAPKTEPEPATPLRDLLHALAPCSPEDWRDAGIFGRVYIILQTPINVMLTLTVPVVDPDETDGRWRQYLQMLQCITAPLFFVFAAQLAFYEVAPNYPVWLLTLIIGGSLALLLWACTRARVRPRGHAAFAFMGFAVAVLWIYTIANEIVNLLATMGSLMGVSQAILGLTVLAWGNSIGDFVSNLTVAKQGFPRMAVGACFGGPALNMLLGLGAAGLSACLQRGHHVTLSDSVSMVLAVSGGFLLLSLVSSLVFIPANGFHANKIYGIYLCALYGAYIVTAVTLEFTSH